jgi:hypothetical protein
LRLPLLLLKRLLVDLVSLWGLKILDLDLSNLESNLYSGIFIGEIMSYLSC